MTRQASSVFANLSLRLFLPAFFLLSNAALYGSYKVLLKDGKVIEARSKPISMEGNYRFTDLQNQFHAIPIQLIDIKGTQSLNASVEQKPKPAVPLTNEDIASKSAERPATSSSASSKPAGVGSSAPKGASLAAGAKRDEAYWRSRAKQIHDEMARVDNEIKALNEKTKSGKSDGIKIGFDTYNQVIYANFESQLKELEKEKEKLQKMRVSLEEEARTSGALPGWLR